MLTTQTLDLFPFASEANTDLSGIESFRFIDLFAGIGGFHAASICELLKVPDCR